MNNGGLSGLGDHAEASASVPRSMNGKVLADSRRGQCLQLRHLLPGQPA